MKRFIWYALVLLYVPCLKGLNQLQKAYLHQVPDYVEAELELGKLVFYFSDKPDIQAIQMPDQSNDNWKHEAYFFSLTEVDNTCRQMLQDIQKNTDFYRILCTEVLNPKQGVKLDLYYDKTQIACICDNFEAITMHKGVVFRLINKKLLNQLATFNKPILQVAQHKSPCIVVDCGHGGSDPGTIGINNIAEKDITLQVGLKVAHLLQQKGYETVLTRKDDRVMALTDRTKITNSKRPDLFISIHANSAPSARAQGIETYCLHPKLFSTKATTCVQEQYFRANIAQIYGKSYRLAQSVHNAVISSIKEKRTDVINRKVRHAVCQVLLGSNTPGALIEIGFLSHKIEASYLTDKTYQQQVAQGICKGISSYLTS